MKSAAATLLTALTKQVQADTTKNIPILDAHIHLFDPTRPQGVPWPPATDTVLYKPSLPGRYKNVTRGLGICGAIAIECSPWESDNDWLLQIAESDPIIVGIIGDLVPGSVSFGKNIDRLSANPLFKGIRYGNLWNRNLSEDMNKPGFLEDLKLLSETHLVFESANPDMELISALFRIKDKIPAAKIVIDHLPNAQIPADASSQKTFAAHLETLRSAPNVFAKLSEIPKQLNGQTSLNLALYKEKLDMLWDTFGEDRLLFGSDWPNGDHLATYADTLGLVQKFMNTKTMTAQEKFFWRNSIAAYGWQPRLSSQPHA
ncbi:amidohydrolase [Acidobacterium sp. S8]|uniref:amidohydrolase family protein n=1 Tax=Acidobacterium sp. S8 TaxID=1641854 RepID=UPI00131D8D7E|nr:amidohydrolase family protein [Acidobacterium sp. S8]